MSDFESVLVGALLAVIFAAWWVWHVRAHPWVKCGRCAGTGDRRTAMLSDRWGNCRRCAGKGKKLRWSARLAGYNLDTGRKRGTR